MNTERAENLKPLAGMRVLDLTWVYSGPYCTLLLQDFGAEVIKIEGPGLGDYARTFPPFRNGRSGYFYSLNRGKKSVALDLKSEAGKAIFRSLASCSDIVVENFVPGVMDRMGVGCEVLRGLNPRLIYGSIHGFGTFGPYANRPAVDPVAQAMGGLMSQSGFLGGPPLKTGPAVTDALSGIYLALGIVGAALERERTGVGKRVEVSMMDAVFSVLEESVTRASMTGDALPRRGNTDPLGAPWDAFETRDGKWVMMCAANGAKCAAVYRAIGREDLALAYGGEGEDASAKRAADLALLNDVFASWAKERTAGELTDMLTGLHVPCGIAKDVAELLDDPQLMARNMVVEIDHPRLGRIKTYNNPVLYDGVSLGIGTDENPLEPELGADGRTVLREVLGLSDGDVDALCERGVLWR
jgi:crotonobetainyl-CoA:carnitine CoA-transferase CaiB-like acyl-CoA transferase